MVGRQTLDLTILVRIQVSQQKNIKGKNEKAGFGDTWRGRV